MSVLNKAHHNSDREEGCNSLTYVMKAFTSLAKYASPLYHSHKREA